MKKKNDLRALILALQESPPGSGKPLTGGFGTLKGGVSQLPVTNESCNNDDVCSNGNRDCTNSWNCTLSSNKGCSNSSWCYA